MVSAEVITYSLLESSKADGLLLLSLGRVILKDSIAEDVDLAIIEDLDAGEEGTVRVPEGIWEEETKDQTGCTGEDTHENEEPEPSWLSSDTSHVENTIGEKFGRSLTELVAKVEEHDTLGSLGSCVPSGQSPETTGDESGFGDTEEETTDDEGGVVVLPRLEDTDDTEEEQLESEPLSGTNTIQDHVGGDLEQHNTERQHLLTNIELILGDVDILEEVVGKSVGDVTTIEFCDKWLALDRSEAIQTGQAYGDRRNQESKLA